jgi:uncharacterized protein YodC (DUF2158 family)
MSEQQFGIGDVVQLQSGGPEMTVAKVNRAYTAEQFVAIAEKVADDMRRPLNDDDNDEPLPDGAEIESYTCMWIDNEGMPHERKCSPQLLRLIRKRGLE